MSTMLSERPGFGPGPEPDVSHTPGIPFSRLVRVELRKLGDTRAGRWLLASVAALTGVGMVITLLIAWSEETDATYLTFTGVASAPMGVLLPVLGVLSVTSEWGQRTHMVTFTLEPNRSRIVSAKLAAGVVVAGAAVLIGFGLGAACNALYGALGDGGAVWNASIEAVASFAILQLIGLLTGFAFGMLIMNTAAAIVTYFVYSFVLPGIFSILATAWESFTDLQPWVDFAYIQAPLVDGDLGGVNWLEFAVASALWFWLPLLLGIWRLLRAEVK
jgi:ABC-type transport system involved in multi-copper enzyme maturation permease subunit